MSTPKFFHTVATEGNTLVRYWLTCRGTARGGWLVKRILRNAEGKEFDGGIAAEFDTKREARAARDRWNEELVEQRRKARQ